MNKQKLNILGKLICKINGHSISPEYFINVCYSYAPSSVLIEHLKDRIHFLNPIGCGFIHYGVATKCIRCDEIVYIDKELTYLSSVCPNGEIFIKSTRDKNDKTTKTKHIG